MLLTATITRVSYRGQRYLDAQESLFPYNAHVRITQHLIKDSVELGREPMRQHASQLLDRTSNRY